MDEALNSLEPVKTHYFPRLFDCWDVYATPLKQVMLVYVDGCTAQCFDPLLNRVHNPKVPEDPDPPPLHMDCFYILLI